MKAFVTGATGFIGYHLVKKLLSMNWEVVCLSRKNSNNNTEFQKEVSWIIGDLFDKKALAEGCSNADIIFHLAGQIKAINKKELFETNANGTKNLIEAILKSNKNTHLIFLSSLSASGPTNKNKVNTESDKNKPISNYGKSKLLAEDIILKNRDNLYSTIIRPGIVYGPKDRETLLFFKLAKFGINLHLGINEQHLSMIFVEDLIQLIIKTTTIKTNSGEIFFASDNDTGYSWNKIMRTIANIMNKKIVTIIIPKFVIKTIIYISVFLANIFHYSTILNLDKYEELKYPNWVCSSQKAKKILKYNPEFSLKNGLEKTYKWYKENDWI
ncbi:MAG: NAD(P)-dependent oxidoreductase [Candidatus Marinimicrobia bacterium]|nr:NAD(P)-dependent oxidoreductase [Candidatus Neomarinimicrobiota bacterium]